MKNQDYFKYIKEKSFVEKLIAFSDAIESMKNHEYRCCECQNENDRKYYSSEADAQRERADFLLVTLIEEYNKMNRYENQIKELLTSEMYDHIRKACIERTDKYGIYSTKSGACKGCKYKYLGEDKTCCCIFGNVPNTWEMENGND